MLLAKLPVAFLVIASVQARTSPKSDFFRDVATDRRLGHLGTCEQDCDRDADCFGDLVCCIRNAGDPVPCCPTKPTDEPFDFCAPSSCCTGTEDDGKGPDPEEDDDRSLCLSGDTTVEVLNKGPIPMSNLNIGDYVHTSNGYEVVYSFAHYQPNRKGDFLEIQGNDGSKLEITSDHLMYLEGRGHPVRASSIRVGDRLIPSGAITTKINVVKKVGLYAPLTASGSLIVNGGVKVSSYAAVVQDTDYAKFQNGKRFLSQHTGIHMLLAPFRVYCRASLELGFDGTSICQTFNEESGLPPHVHNGISLLTWANEQNLAVQMLLFMLAFPFFASWMALECLLFNRGACFLLLSMALPLAVVIVSKKKLMLGRDARPYEYFAVKSKKWD